ncbi:MAG: alanine:cation symporter family protein [Proteobacteria bacterium]|nr:alanine:cation symporter family protein [Pseudomonadota bacterium]
MIDIINSVFEQVASFGLNLLMFDILFFIEGQTVEFLIAFLIISSIALMFLLRFPNFKYILAPLKLLRDKTYKKVEFQNSISSQTAFWSSIAGCVGVGNITGMCAAVYFGGAGTIFWIVICGFITMPLRYAEVLFGHKLRIVEGNAITECGPFAYIHYAMKNHQHLYGFAIKLFAVLFILAGFGALSVQVNPMVNVIVTNGNVYIKCAIALILCVMIFHIVTGGFKRIAAVASNLGVVMSLLYIVVILLLLFYKRENIGNAFALIFHEAFNIKSVYGGILTIIFLACKRAIISTEVGFGTISLLHGRSDRTSSKDEAKLAMIAPFFGTVVFCSLNGLMLVTSGAFTHGDGGIETMRYAFVNFHPLMNYMLMVIICMFGFSTIITWFYYVNSALKRITSKPLIIKGLPIVYCFLLFFSALVTFSTILLIIDFTTLLITIPNTIVLLYLVFYFRKQKKDIF